MENYKKIILFDGVCNLCNATVQFVIKKDKKDLFRFTPLQSDTGKKLLTERNIDTEDIDSIILIEPNVAYYVYDFVAKNRYKWYGKKDSCMIPTEELKNKFI